MAIFTPRTAERSPSTLLGIPDGPSGIAVTLHHMGQFARQYFTDPYIRAATRQAIAQVSGKDIIGETRAIQHFVWSAVRYTEDPLDVEMLQTPVETLQDGHGDCDDQATLVAAMLMSIGRPARFAAVALSAPGAFEHVFAETRIGTRWWSVETTEAVEIGWWPDTPYPPMIRHI